jgi:gamma-polyglutamate synthase
VAALILCLLVLLALGAAERLARDRDWRDVQVRVHVNGTRGKSTVTRLIWAALREAGIPALGKTTGTAPRLLLPDGREEPLRRWAPPSIREQLAAIRRARRLGARAAVIECMALDPMLQYVSEREMVRATIGVVTNVRFDHEEVMGATREEIASTLANTVPRDALLVAAPGPFLPIFESRAAALRTRVVVAAAPAEHDAGREPWDQENRALALAVTRQLGVDDEVARRGFDRAPLDPGSVVRGACRLPAGVAHWTDATAANDPESLALLLDSFTAWSGPRGQAPDARVLVYHHRDDRGSRLVAFARRSAAFAEADRVVVSGARPPLTVWRQARRCRGGKPLEFVGGADLAGWLRGHAAGAALAFCGNTRGLDVTRLLQEAASRD